MPRLIIIISALLLLTSCRSRHHTPTDVWSWGYKGHLKQVTGRYYTNATLINGQWQPDTTTLLNVRIYMFDKDGKQTGQIMYRTDTADSSVCTRIEHLDNKGTEVRHWRDYDGQTVSFTTSLRKWANDSTLYYQDWDSALAIGEPDKTASVMLDARNGPCRIITRYADGCISTSYILYKGDTAYDYRNKGEQDEDSTTSVALQRDKAGNKLKELDLPSYNGITITTYEYY